MSKIGYLTPDAPAVDLPAYRGERYQALIPDTLDIAERARLVTNALHRATDPAADCEPYWIVVFRSEPAHMFHNCWQSTGWAKWIMATSMARIVSGVEHGREVEQTQLHAAMKCRADDGLFYNPIEGRPWAFEWSPVSAEEMRRRSPRPGQILSPMGNGTLMTCLSHYALLDDNPRWKESLRAQLAGMLRMTVDAGDQSAFWPSFCYGVAEPPTDARLPQVPFEAETSIAAHAMVHAYRALQDDSALDGGRRIINYLRRTFYEEDGTFLACPGERHRAHFHAHARGLLAMQEYVEQTGDADVRDFVSRAYRRAKQHLANHEIDTMGGGLAITELPGANLVGFFPEWANSSMGEKGETCQLTDMTALALRLGQSGSEDAWDDADRWIRNQLAEDQLTDVDWIDRLPKDVPIQPHASTEDVACRNLGSFTGGPDPNDWASGVHMHVLGHCCTVNGAKVLYWIWDRILTHEAGRLDVNLLLNRASPWADVDSYVPYAGQVDIRVKRPVTLRVRLPEWARPRDLVTRVDGTVRETTQQGRYAVAGEVAPGQTVTCCFPLPNRTDHVHIEKRPYTLKRRGNDVIAIDPPGRYLPLYQRQHYASGSPRFRRVERFIPERVVHW